MTQKQTVLVFSCLAGLVFLAAPGRAASMSSANHRVNTSVVAGGGGTATSGGFRLQGTVGQSTPLLDPPDPPGSASYALYPGFWYTVGRVGCLGDRDGDRDVDGWDLAAFAAELGPVFNEADLDALAGQFGAEVCP